MDIPKIIAFTKDWNDVPTCTTHILREMGKELPVLWVSSIGTRKPSLGSGRDLGRVFARLKRLFARAEWKENNLRVISPLLMPKAESRFMRWVNRKLFAWYVRRERNWMGDGPIEYWCFVPNAIDLINHEIGSHRGTEDTEQKLETPVPGVNGNGVTGHPSSAKATAGKRGVVGVLEPAAFPKLGNPPCGRSGARFAVPAGTGHGVSAKTLNLQPGTLNHKPAKLIYYCVDDWSEFEHLDTAWMAEKERKLLKSADVVFATSKYLVDKCARSARMPVHYMPHGVEYEKFAATLEPPACRGVAQQRLIPGEEGVGASGCRGGETTGSTTPLEPAAPAGSRARATGSELIGFYGNICAWIDFELVAELARARPNWRFVMIGPINADVAVLECLSNEEFPGRVEHDDLPLWCARFDAAIIPYDLDHPRMKSVNPVKARELLSAGVPIVASRLPDLEDMEPDILLANTVDQWLAALEKQIQRTDRNEISAKMAAETWTAKVAEIRNIIDHETHKTHEKNLSKEG